MHQFKFIIIGAGPSGLTLAHVLRKRGVPAGSLLVIEKEQSAGGLCRSEIVDGAPLDIGGGHFLDVRYKNVLDFIFQFMPEAEWNRHTRVSKINLNGRLIDHPIESNLWQLGTEAQIDYLESIARAGCIAGEPMPSSFSEWIGWKLGKRIAHDYMLPYNRKIWSMDLNLLGTYWLHKLPNVSFRETLRSCLEKTTHGGLPAHEVFLYLKNQGYGELWRRMADGLGDSLLLGSSIDEIDIETLTINGKWQAGHIFNSAPWHHWQRWSSLPHSLLADINELKHTGIDVDYIPETPRSDAHWIYEPDESLACHRKLLRSNFCTNARGHWTETNSLRSSPGFSGWRHSNEYAYPVNTLGKADCIQRVLCWAQAHGITGFGRWGAWEHMNSDIAVKNAIELGYGIKL